MKSVGCLASLILIVSSLAWSQTPPPRVESFAPQGRVKHVRQVRVRFSDVMVPMGDPQAALDPFEITCPSKGTGRWADSRNWVFDFAEPTWVPMVWPSTFQAASMEVKC